MKVRGLDRPFFFIAATNSDTVAPSFKHFHLAWRLRFGSDGFFLVTSLIVLSGVRVRAARL